MGYTPRRHFMAFQKPAAHASGALAGITVSRLTSRSCVLRARPDNKEEKIVGNIPKADDLRASYLYLALLVVLFSCNQWSRQAIYYLCDFSSSGDALKHINVDIGFDKDAYASLAALVFSVVFTFFSFFTGSVSDSYDRRNIAVISCIIWSLSTMAQALASSYTDLVVDRVIIAASQSFFNPAAYTLISELFPPQLVGTMNGIFSGGIFIGGALASLSILLDGQIGWRNTVGVIGAVGLLTALLGQLVLRDPRSENQLATSPAQTTVLSPLVKNVSSSVPMQTMFDEGLTAVQEILQSRQAQKLYLASAFRFTAGLSIVIWKAPFIFSKFPESGEVFASTNAAIVVVGGLVSTFLGGYISDILANRGQQAHLSDNNEVKKLGISRSWVPAIGSLLAAPLWAGFLLAPDPQTALLCLFGEYLAAECWFGPTLATLFNIVAKERRGAAQGLFSVLLAVGNVGPLLVSFLTERLPSTMQIHLDVALLAIICGSYMISGALFASIAVEEDRLESLRYK